MHVEEFATECGWDHLYIFDGDSVKAPLIGVFTGLMHKDDYHVRRIPEIIARSGSAFLHFYSDVAYNMSGFNITYRVNACPSRFVQRFLNFLKEKFLEKKMSQRLNIQLTL